MLVFLLRNKTLALDGGGIRELLLLLLLLLLQGSIAASGDGGRKDLVLASNARIDVALILIGLFSFIFCVLFDKNMS